MKYSLPSQSTWKSSVILQRDSLVADFVTNNIPATKTDNKSLPKSSVFNKLM